MNAGRRLAAYGAGLVVAFGAAFAVAGAVAPDDVAAAWSGPEEQHDGETTGGHSDGHDEPESEGQGADRSGLSLDTAGFVLSPVAAPERVGADGELSFRVLDADSEPVTEYTTLHEKDLHLVVVRSDGTQFRHVHPELDPATGTWTIPWRWAAAGTHRVYADFTPAGAEQVTLTRAVQVAGDFTPAATTERRTDEVDGFTVTLAGHLATGAASELTVTVERAGEPVTTLEPYLGAFGHLVALREGDLAYLHVHALGDEPRPGDTAGPEVGFAAEVPTAGRYLLYLDFRVDGAVHTAEFVLDAEH